LEEDGPNFSWVMKPVNRETLSHPRIHLQPRARFDDFRPYPGPRRPGGATGAQGSVFRNARHLGQRQDSPQAKAGLEG